MLFNYTRHVLYTDLAPIFQSSKIRFSLWLQNILYILFVSAEPEKFVPPLARRALPPPECLPKKRTHSEVKAMFPLKVELNGYCPVTYLDGKLRSVALFLIRNFYVLFEKFGAHVLVWCVSNVRNLFKKCWKFNFQNWNFQKGKFNFPELYFIRISIFRNFQQKKIQFSETLRWPETSEPAPAQNTADGVRRVHWLWKCRQWWWFITNYINVLIYSFLIQCILDFPAPD